MKPQKGEQNTVINPSDILFIDGEFTQTGGELLSLSIVDYDGNPIRHIQLVKKEIKHVKYYKPKVAKRRNKTRITKTTRNDEKRK